MRSKHKSYIIFAFEGAAESSERNVINVAFACPRPDDAVRDIKVEAKDEGVTHRLPQSIATRFTTDVVVSP